MYIDNVAAFVQARLHPVDIAVIPPPAASKPPPGETQTRWFTQEVHAHEASLRSYLRGSFPAVRDIDDVVQESYLRVWRTAATKPIRSAKAFLFTVARRLALDHTRRDRNCPIETAGHFDSSTVLEDKPNTLDELGRRERIELLADAIAVLPARCREVFVLYKIKGLSRKEAAVELGVSEKTVEVHTANAMRHCEAFFQRKGVKGMFDDDTR